MAKQIKLVKSLSGRKKDQVATANSLGLKKIGDVTVQPENAAPSVRFRRSHTSLRCRKHKQGGAVE